MTALATVNPFYAARFHRAASRTQSQASRNLGLRQTASAPRTGSPVPHLTSLYHFHRAGEYGDRSWPGNCGGNLIKDLLTLFPAGPGA